MKKKYMTFRDLVWEPHSTLTNIENAYMEFPNGTSISVLRGNSVVGELRVYCSGGTYEVLATNPFAARPRWQRGWLKSFQVTNVMRYLQKLEEKI